MHLVGDGLSVQQNILPRIASGSNEVFLLSRWGILVIQDSPPKIVGMAFVGLQQVWGVNRGVDRTLRGVSERIGNG